MQPQAGGSFAPPLSDETLARYRAMTDGLPASPVKDALAALLHCCGVWWDLPEPTGPARGPHRSGVGAVVRLDADHAAALDPHIPWAHEIEAYKVLFDGISNETAKPLRDAAHHLLWHVVELDLGREPLTADKLTG